MRKNNVMKEKRLCAAQEDGSADICLNDTITINREEFTEEIDHVAQSAFENALWFKMFVSLTAKTDKWQNNKQNNNKEKLNIISSNLLAILPSAVPTAAHFSSFITHIISG